MPDDPRYYMDFTGTGNSAQPGAPARAAADHGLAALLRRSSATSTASASTSPRRSRASSTTSTASRPSSTSIHQDPVLSQVKLIAEPWDVGPGGYQVGNFPVLWTEWNGIYRDTMRDFWRGQRERRRVRDALHRLDRPLPVRRAPAVRVDQLRHRARRLHAATTSSRTTRSTTRRTSRTTATAPTTTAAGTAASRGRPTTRRSSRSARGSSATSSRRCCSRRACRCCSAATSSGARSTATTTRGARTTSSRGSTGSSTPEQEELLEFTRRLIALRDEHPVFRARRGSSRAAGAPARLPDVWWFRPDGRRMTQARLEARRRAHARRLPERRGGRGA